MTQTTYLPLDVIYARICQENGIEASSVEEAVSLLESLLDSEGVGQKKLAAALIAVGWNHRKACHFEEAGHMLLQAVKYSRTSAFDMSRDTARALWFLAEAHYVDGNFTVARSVFWSAVKNFAKSVGLFDEEAQACMAEFAELAEGFARDEDLAEEVDDIIAFADFCESVGTDGHITVLAS